MRAKLINILDKLKVLWNPKDRSFVVLSALGLIFILSLGLFLVRDRPMGRFVLFFPHQKEKIISGEERYLPLDMDRTKTMELIVKENILGPVRPDNYRLFGPGTRLNSFIFDRGQAYIDLSPEATFSWNTNNYWTLEEALKIIEDSLKFNFKEITNLNVTVAGQVPLSDLSEKK